MFEILTTLTNDVVSFEQRGPDIRVPVPSYIKEHKKIWTDFLFLFTF